MLQLVTLSCDSYNLLLRCYKALMYLSSMDGLLLCSVQVSLHVTALECFCCQLLLQLHKLSFEGNIAVMN